MRHFLISTALLLATITTLNAQEIQLEVEQGQITGTSVATSISGYSGTGYVGVYNDGDKIDLNITAEQSGSYNLEVRYNGNWMKKQHLYLNGEHLGELTFDQTIGFEWKEVGGIYLQQGNNTLSIVKSWGWTEFDAIRLTLRPPNDYSNVSQTLVDPSATESTKKVYQTLLSYYGTHVISGQVNTSGQGAENDFDQVIALTGKTPVIQGFDFQNYSPANPWGWGDNGPEFSSWDDGEVQRAIDWYQNTDGKGMVTFQWHWFSPMNGTIRTSTFMANNTTFDVRNAVVNGTPEYDATIRDIDAIAAQLKRMADLDIPILWRPLHEAGGMWFWWGEYGPEPALALYDIMYDRLTNYHGLHNLIWVWASPEPEWYPGNSKVDIVGFDSYPGENNYTNQKLHFDQMHDMVEGQKMLALTENGPIPDPVDMIEGDAPWSYFMTWGPYYDWDNEASHVINVFNHDYVITLDELEEATNPIVARNFWDFETGIQGWTFNPTAEGKVSDQGIMTVNYTGNNPLMYSQPNLEIDASSLNHVVLRLKNNSTATAGRLLWTTSTSPEFSGDKALYYSITPNATDYEYVFIDLTEINTWDGIITQLRLDPVIATSFGGTEFDFIQVLGGYPAGAHPVPGIVWGEKYNSGGQGNAYFDLDSENQGGQYRTEGVDIQYTSDITGTYNVGWMESGEWLEYLVDVQQNAKYQFNLRCAAPNQGSVIEVWMDHELLASVNIEQTDDWDFYLDNYFISSLTEGKHLLKLVIQSGGCNLNFIDIEPLLITSTEQVPDDTPLVVVQSHDNGFNIQLEDLVYLSFYDYTGKKIFEQTFIGSTPPERITTQDLSPGYYIYRATEKGGKSQRGLLLKH